MKTINDLNITQGTRVLLRLDLNVPITESGEITDDFRIRESIPTILLLQNLGAKVIILAHKEKGSLETVANYLAKEIQNFSFLKEVLSSDGLDWPADYSPENGEVILLENVRINSSEKNADMSVRDAFAEKLSKMGDVYVNDAFSASHRDHASITSIPKFLPSALGPNFIKEITALQMGMDGEHPMLLILGGAKFDTKLALLERFVNIADTIFVGGALAHSFWKSKGMEIGTSLIDNEVKLSGEILNSNKIILPKDIQNQNKENKKLEDVKKDDKITDFGQDTFAEILNILDVSKTIIWNGPLDYYEAGYDWGTKMLIETLSKMPDKTIILGGGDTVAEIDKVKKTNPNIKFTHVSTGGGAMIDFLAKGTLPGIDAIK